jgi:hypothetical protein
MKRSMPLLAAFGGTMIVLLVAVVVLQAIAGGTTAVGPTPGLATLPPLPTAGATVRLTPHPAPTLRPDLRPTPDPNATPVPEPTDSPDATPHPDYPPGTIVEIVVQGSRYVDASVPETGTISRVSGGGVVIETTRQFSIPLILTYRLPTAQLPRGVKFGRVDVAICGKGSGDFWESYGHAGAEPYEHEVDEPGPDGCWHYTGGRITDTKVYAIVQNGSKLRIDRVVYKAYAR